MLKEILNGLDVMYIIAVLVMIAVIVAMGVDFLSGWRKAKLRGDEHTSYAASRSLTKFLTYGGILLIGVCIDTMIHFAWAMLMEGSYFVPLMTILWGIILSLVEAWSVRERADKKQRKRMDEAAAALAKVLDKETVLEILKARVREKETQNIGSGTTLDNDDF